MSERCQDKPDQGLQVLCDLAWPLPSSQPCLTYAPPSASVPALLAFFPTPPATRAFACAISIAGNSPCSFYCSSRVTSPRSWLSPPCQDHGLRISLSFLALLSFKFICVIAGQMSDPSLDSVKSCGSVFVIGHH